MQNSNLKKLRLGTRGSALALVQADYVSTAIRAKFPDIVIEQVVIQTSGDRFTGDKLADAGGKALFVKEIEEALLQDKIDLAVHSLKDVPGEIPSELTLAAFPPREDPRDCFLSLSYSSLETLPKGATLGTSSPRRESQALSLRSDLKIKPIRGNVDTRLKKLASKEYDAILLAAAGLKRLGKEKEIREYFEADFVIPSVGQGILAIEVKKDRSDLIDLLRTALNNVDAEIAATTERAFLQMMGGDCFTPLGAHARVADNQVRLFAWLGNPNGSQKIRIEKKAPIEYAEKLGRAVAKAMLEQGGKEILDAIAAHQAGRTK